jgi:hypothetical protein
MAEVKKGKPVRARRTHGLPPRNDGCTSKGTIEKDVITDASSSRNCWTNVRFISGLESAAAMN